MWLEDASYTYYLHGPLARTELGNLKVQGIDYIYTLQGWLKGINAATLEHPYEMGQDGWPGTSFSRVSRDVYAYGLGYFDEDYKPVGGSSAPAMGRAVYSHPAGADNSGRQLFNGNISNTIISLSKIDAGNAKGYSYGYDQLNRLVYMNQHSVSGTTWSNTNIISAYAEAIAYDANGNILKYLRKGANLTGMPLDMDSLSYKYNRDGSGNLVNNKLRQVKDAVSASNYSVDIDDQSDVDNYTYDKIGNIINDDAEGLDTIRWTVYGKINRIVKEEANTIVEYGYDPGGDRTLKRIETEDEEKEEKLIVETFYVRDAQGNVLAIYSKKASGEIVWNEQLLFGSRRIGTWNWDTILPAKPPIVTDGLTPVHDSMMCGRNIYELNNHLKNVVTTLTDKKVGIDSSGITNFYVPEVLQQTDYYPFGMSQSGRRYIVREDYRYGFNGKENDDEVNGDNNVEDYGMRVYNNRLGRFFSVDPMSSCYPMLSTYQFSGNSPIAGIDLDGAEFQVVHLEEINERGKPIFRVGETRGYSDVHFRLKVRVETGYLPDFVEISEPGVTVSLQFKMSEIGISAITANVNGVMRILPDGMNLGNLPALDDPIWETLETTEQFIERIVSNGNDLIRTVSTIVDLKYMVRDAKRELKNNAATDKLGPKKVNLDPPDVRAKRLRQLERGRPKHIKGFAEEVWDKAKEKGGGAVFDPSTGKEITWDKSKRRRGQWDLGHIQDKEYRKL